LQIRSFFLSIPSFFVLKTIRICKYL
jgi:hypothetical protein